MEKKEEKKKKIMKKQIKWPLLIITGILFIFLTMNVYALGISPGRTTFNFEPGIEKEVNFSIVNTDNKAMNIHLH